MGENSDHRRALGWHASCIPFSSMELDLNLEATTESAADLLAAARTLGDVLDLAGAGFALLDRNGDSLVENRCAQGLPRSRAWLALAQRREPVDFDHRTLIEFFSSVSQELYGLLSGEGRARRIGEGPFHVGALRTRCPGPEGLTTLLFTSSMTHPVVRILLARLSG